jgi:hypothetical protein
MEIKNGFVQWNGRNDIPCTYAEMEDSTKYYFKQELSNGNHIVTTSLLEAVDPMAKAKNIGLLSVDGRLLIPCNNSSIKMVEEILLVEPAEAVSENVIEANKLRLDPLSATRLVSTPAKIKEKINAKMSPKGRYLANDQFSEVTVTDLDGNNLVNGEYYSFVAKDDNTLYMTKNVIESDVLEFSVTDKKLVEKVTEPIQEVIQPVEQSTEVVVPTEEVTPSELNSIYGSEDIGEEISIPVVDNVDANEDIYDSPSFGEIKEETPIVEVDGGENVEVNEDDYKQESEVERSINSMKEKEERFDEYNSLLSQFQGSGAYEFNSEFKPDTIDKSEVEDINDDSIDEDKKVIDDVSQILNGFTNTISTKDKRIRSLEEENEELSKENSEMRMALKEAETRKNQDAMTISSLEDDKEEQRATITKLEEEKKELKAEIDTLKTTADLYKRREEESRRNMKTLVRAVKNFEIARGMTEDEEVKVRAA